MLTTDNLNIATGKLTPRSPFDFAKTLGFLHAFTPTAGEQDLTVNSVIKAVTLHDRAIAFELRSTGTTEEPQLAYTLFTELPLNDIDHAAVADRIRFFLSLDDDLQPFYAIGCADPRFAPVIKRFYGLHQPKFLTPFEIACWAVLAQRVPMPIAHRMKMALVERWGTSISLPTGTYHAFPAAEQLAVVELGDLATIVGNKRKAEYLRAVIEFFNEVDEQFLRTGDYDQVVASLRGIRGIGEWSSHFILVRGLGRMERVSAIDKELSTAAARIYNGGHTLTNAEMQRLLDQYGTSQGYWAFYARIATLDRPQAMGMQ